MKVVFGAGCFWHVEDLFSKIPGVTDTMVGYLGGTLDNPSYEDICRNNTGHAEVVQVDYDQSKVTFQELLDVFWNNHDPTTLNRQGPDVGNQYRSAIFYHDEEQRTLAEKSKNQMNDSKKFTNQIVTEITKATQFYPAEDYHQKYFKKCGINR